MNRRTFVTSAIAAGTGIAFNEAIAKGADVKLPSPPSILRHGLPDYPKSALGMPGLFPGRVVEVHDVRAIHENHVSEQIVQKMIGAAMQELTGEKSSGAAWARFVTPRDVVGIKINPSGAPACCSSPEIVREVIRGVMSAGVPAKNILIYDRYSREIQLGSYHALMPEGIRIDGIEHRAFDLSGYDMNVYCQASFFGEWETRSYLARVVSQEVTKIVNIPTMKDHSAAGVTGCLKNLGYGSFNNVARSHRAPVTFTDPLIGLMCSVEPLRSKAVLHIMDGMRQVWHGGPLTQVQKYIAQPGLILAGTDPVAIDTIELNAISEKRRQERALSLWDRDPANITADGEEFYTNPHKNLFFRQPAHIEAAGRLGLGVWETAKIDHRKIEMG
ncbi:MAG: DUF362 domain-containing protein [Acidobacteriota bacterium]|nr:DUF362 domain-containing protein [Acidobacteriota bacterium]